MAEKKEISHADPNKVPDGSTHRPQPEGDPDPRNPHTIPVPKEPQPLPPEPAQVPVPERAQVWEGGDPGKGIPSPQRASEAKPEGTPETHDDEKEEERKHRHKRDDSPLI
jgi:hypothetical protein